MPDDIDIPEEALSERFLAATGPGGQNVNKVASACQLRVDVFKLGLPPHAYEKLKRLGLAPHAYGRLKQIAGSRMTTGGELVITARRYRTQEGNRADARARLAEMLAQAHIVQAKRKPTRPGKAAKARRVDAKKQRGAVKQARGKVSFD
jgi:ribosome-associated protein